MVKTRPQARTSTWDEVNAEGRAGSEACLLNTFKTCKQFCTFNCFFKQTEVQNRSRVLKALNKHASDPARLSALTSSQVDFKSTVGRQLDE